VTELSDVAKHTDNRSVMLRISNSVNHVRYVQKLLLNVFHQLLVNHFAILLSQNKIVWPEHNTWKMIAFTS
jgi:hypothetical protein